MKTRTKIICTIGPASKDLDTLKKLIEAGMNVARLNLSHGSNEQHKEIISNIKKARKQTEKPVAILLDTKGPEIRVGDLLTDAIEVKEKMQIKLVAKAKEQNDVAIEPFDVLQTINEGMTILINDGYIVSKVIKKAKDHILIETQNIGHIRPRNKINIPEAYLNLPAMTEKDKEDLTFACKEDIDIIAASFIRSAEHVLEIKHFLGKQKKTNIFVMAKIENKEGIENFDHIVEIADGIMVARGDLGVEVDLSLVPQLQKMMIEKTTQRGKPVAIATQMLESMIYNPRPTRAEVSDVANAIYDSTSLVMLSAETAMGKYPVETVRVMKNIIAATESDFDYFHFFQKESTFGYSDVSSAVAIAAVKTAYSADAKAIFIYSSSGFTARLVSHFRPEKIILALTTNEKTYHQLAMNWGVVPCFVSKCKDSDAAFDALSKIALDKGYVHFGDLIIVTAGIPFGKKGSTNLMRIESIGAILVRGMFGNGNKVQGKVKVIMLSNGHSADICKGNIIVIPRCDDSYGPLFKVAKGVILQNNIADVASENYAISLAQTHNVPLVVRTDNAMSLLEDGMKIEMDPEQGLVYKV